MVTEDSSLQWLQQKILHRILPVKSYLKKIGIRSSDACWFCDEKEDIIHTFILCPSISQLWVNLSYHIYVKTRSRIGFNIKNIIFGEPHCKRNIPINFIIMYTKSFIYKCSRQDKTTRIIPLLKYIYYNFKLHKYLAIRNQKEDNFRNNWKVWDKIFEDLQICNLFDNQQ